jgi:hypothetical protein
MRHAGYRSRRRNCGPSNNELRNRGTSALGLRPLPVRLAAAVLAPVSLLLSIPLLSIPLLLWIWLALVPLALWLVTTGRTKSPGPDSKVDHWSFSVIAKYRAKNSSAAWMMMPARAPRPGRICFAETINAAVINQIDGFFGMSLGALVI